MTRSYVVTGGGRAIVERLLAEDAGVVVIELDPAVVEWIATHPRSEQLVAVVDSAADQDVCEQAADRAAALASIFHRAGERGWSASFPGFSG